jgi:hypothetical protein
MHNFTGGKARMKDVGVLLLAIMQRLLKDKKGFYPLVMVSNFAHSVSSILIFLVAANYWNEQTASSFILALPPVKLCIPDGHPFQSLKCAAPFICLHASDAKPSIVIFFE